MKLINQFIFRVLGVVLFILPSGVYAESVDLKDIGSSQGEGTTTIQIKKEKNSPLNSAKVVWETTEGAAEIEGEPGVLVKQAKLNWKEACKEWEKTFRADNKDNKIVSISCGFPSCKDEASAKVCRSEVKYKIRTRIDQ